MTEDQIKHMVSRFLGWKLPANFSPDAGISFKAAYNEHMSPPSKHEPTGTNLFDVGQADAMVRYMIAGIPADPGRPVPHHGSGPDYIDGQVCCECGKLSAYANSDCKYPGNHAGRLGADTTDYM